MAHQAWKPKISLNRSTSTPLHEQISEPIQRAILDGIITPGTLIENEVALASRLQVSRPTTRRAMQTLVDRGLLLRRRGSGTIVAPKTRHQINLLSSLYTDIRREGKVSTTDILHYELISANKLIAEKLGCSIGEPVLELERLRFKDGIPVAILFNWLPKQIAPSYNDLLNEGLYQLLLNNGVDISSTEQSVGAERPKRRAAKLLGITTREPVLTINRTAFDEEGRIIEWGRHIYRGDIYRYESTVFSKVPKIAHKK